MYPDLKYTNFPTISENLNSINMYDMRTNKLVFSTHVEQRIKVHKMIKIQFSRMMVESFYLDDEICDIEEVSILMQDELGFCEGVLYYSEDKNEESFKLSGNEFVLYTNKIKRTKDLIIYYSSYADTIQKEYKISVRHNENNDDYQTQIKMGVSSVFNSMYSYTDCVPQLHDKVKYKYGLVKSIKLKLFTKMVDKNIK